METQEKLEKEVGTKEAEILKPAKVKVEKVNLVEVKFGNQVREKLVCAVKHPDREEPIEISKVKYQKKDKLQTSGLWYKEDEDSLIQKGTALAELLNFTGSGNIKSLIGKEIDTVADEEGYLCFKAY